MAYYLEMRDDQASNKVDMGGNEIDGPPSTEVIEEEIRDWVEGGDWGSDGVCVSTWWALTDEDGEEIETGTLDVEIEPDHDVLISAAGGDTECDHDWTAEGEGGCTENPGVWSTGGTSMIFATHCRKCGLHRVEHSTGSQRNPGEHDTWTYEQPSNWCAECEHEECSCEHAEAE